MLFLGYIFVIIEFHEDPRYMPNNLMRVVYYLDRDTELGVYWLSSVPSDFTKKRACYPQVPTSKAYISVVSGLCTLRWGRCEEQVLL